MGTWRSLTTNMEILNYVQGVSLVPDFSNVPKDKNPIKFSEEEKFHLSCELEKFCEKQIINKVHPVSQQIISNIFLRKKSDDTFRVILNLSNLNRILGKVHFKMDSLNTVLNIITKDAWLGKIDLKDAYYSVPIDETSNRFYSQGELYEYQCLAQGFVDAPRIFTKIMKIPLSYLRSKGFLNVGYLDDIFIQGDSFEECQDNIFSTVKLLDDLGFTIHLAKSVVIPTQILEFLGFTINSRSMTIYPTPKKANDIISTIKDLLHRSDVTIRDLSRIVGKLIAVSPGNKVGPIFYKRIENYNITKLKQNRGLYDSIITLSEEVKEDLKWWILNINSFPRPLITPPYSIEISTDACKTGWGAHFYDNSTGGIWDESEKQLHINEQELKALELSLFSFCKDMKNVHIHIFSDNTTTVACINKKGSTKPILNNFTRIIWLWAIKNNNFLTASHIPGKENIIADTESRKLIQSETEWKLNPNIFNNIVAKLGPFQADLFASRLNFQMIPYFSWNPDPLAKCIDAFHVNWQNIFGYCFPIIGKILHKVESEEATICLVCPAWRSQAYFPKLLRLLIDYPFLIPNRKGNLLHPSNKQMIHPLSSKLNLMACIISGRQSPQKHFKKELLITSKLHGVEGQPNNITVTSKSGLSFALYGKLIHTKHF